MAAIEASVRSWPRRYTLEEAGLTHMAEKREKKDKAAVVSEAPVAAAPVENKSTPPKPKIPKLPKKNKSRLPRRQKKALQERAAK